MCDFSCYGGPSEEWLAVESTLPPPPTTSPKLSMAELRRIENQKLEVVSNETMKSFAHRIYSRDYMIPTRDGSFIAARSYRPVSVRNDTPLPVYIHVEGGGFTVGTLDGEAAICARIACGSQVVVLSVSYRKVPEHPYPIPFDDAEDAFEWAHDNMDQLVGNPNKVIIGGISAGGWISASLTLQRHLSRESDARPPIAGQVLMIPCLVYSDCYEPQLKKMKDPSISSYNQQEKAPLFTIADHRYYSSLLGVKDPDATDTKLNPGNASPEQVKGMPPTVLGVVGLDPLRDEALLYAKMLTEAGVPTDVNLFLGMPHGFRRCDDTMPSSLRWDKVIEDGILWALSGPMPNNQFEIKV